LFKIRVMKYVVIMSALLIGFSCANHKEKVNEIESHEELVNKEEDSITSPENYRVIGLVHVSETECPLYIEAKLTNGAVNMYPMNLDEKYKREGMKIKFAYELSRGAQPENCELDMVVSVSDVTLMR